MQQTHLASFPNKTELKWKENVNFGNWFFVTFSIFIGTKIKLCNLIP